MAVFRIFRPKTADSVRPYAELNVLIAAMENQRGRYDREKRGRNRIRRQSPDRVRPCHMHISPWFEAFTAGFEDSLDSALCRRNELIAD